jgi:hypothetical protein
LIAPNVPWQCYRAQEKFAGAEEFVVGQLSGPDCQVSQEDAPYELYVSTHAWEKSLWNQPTTTFAIAYENPSFIPFSIEFSGIHQILTLSKSGRLLLDVCSSWLLSSPKFACQDQNKFVPFIFFA